MVRTFLLFADKKELIMKRQNKVMKRIFLAEKRYYEVEVEEGTDVGKAWDLVDNDWAQRWMEVHRAAVENSENLTTDECLSKCNEFGYEKL